MKEFVSWELIDECVTEIAFHIKDKDIEFEGVYGIPRGGIILAVMLSHKLDIPYLSGLNGLYGKKFIVIDDIADTGTTLERYKRLEVCAGAYYVTIHEHDDSIVKPNFSVIDKENKWIVYPWERDDSEPIPDYLQEEK